jgi:hypothetical protein
MSPTRVALFVLPFALAFAGTFACSTKTTVVNEPAADSATSDAGGENDTDAEPAEPEPFALTSSAFADGDTLPEKYSCGGANVSPPLEWTKGPEPRARRATRSSSSTPTTA